MLILSSVQLELTFNLHDLTDSRHFEMISFFPENKAWYFMQMSPQETICMKWQALLSRKNKKNITKFSSANSVSKMT